MLELILPVPEINTDFISQRPAALERTVNLSQLAEQKRQKAAKLLKPEAASTEQPSKRIIPRPFPAPRPGQPAPTPTQPGQPVSTN